MRPSHHLPSLLGPLLSIAFLVLLVLVVAGLVLWLVKRRQTAKGQPGAHPHPHWQPGAPPGPPPGPQPPVNALQILDERLARGDVEVDDYLTRRAALLGDHPANGTEFQHEQPGAPADRPETSL